MCNCGCDCTTPPQRGSDLCRNCARGHHVVNESTARALRARLSPQPRQNPVCGDCGTTLKRARFGRTRYYCPSCRKGVG